MNHIPVYMTHEEFEKYVEPCLSKAKRGFVCIIPLYKIYAMCNFFKNMLSFI